MEKSREEKLNELKEKYTKETSEMVKDLIKIIFFINTLTIATINKIKEIIKNET